MSRRLHVTAVGAAAVMLALALADFALRPSPEQVAAGQPVFYALYVNVFDRLPVLIVWIGVIGVCAVIGRARGGWSRPAAASMVLLTAAVVTACLLTPIRALVTNSAVRHVDTLRAAGITWHLYSQPTLARRCDVVLLRCEGGLCRFAAAFDEPVCLGVRTPYRLAAAGEGVAVFYGADEVARFPR